MKLTEKDQEYVPYNDVLVQPTAGIGRRILAYTEDLMCVENTFTKGTVAAMHHHPHKQITYIVSGVFEFTVGDTVYTVSKGDTLLKQPDMVHGCVCVEDGAMLDVFTPMRKDFVGE